MGRVTTEDVPSWSYRGLEVFLIIPALFIGVFAAVSLAATFLGFGSGSGTGLSGALVGFAVVWIAVVFLALVSAVTIPILLYIDAEKVARQNLDWQPSGPLYAVVGFVFSGLAVWYYIYRRHYCIVDRVETEVWWYVALVGIATVIGGIALNRHDPSLLYASAIGVPILTLGIYKDASYVCSNSDWQPNPVTHFLAAFITGLLSILSLVYFGYYAYKRYKYV